jgi:hypothetical protein
VYFTECTALYCTVAHDITRKATELAKAMRAAKKGKKSYDAAAAERKAKIEESAAAKQAGKIEPLSTYHAASQTWRLL